ncbi:MAG: isoprenylcysteine carboxylmethyltransferase family protein [Gammaproteobacteria bacterium]|jgi:protein-S-isoprenylcysteine O-methyltransferase Ste14|nr:isoprenylcysteine carboxylmethyltransferase family protein [Gammaproteobacteria bacterium]MBT5542008.1 isoprenylcysteine carboxylmethyltransferase family protein [Gammaproteobacteria bacterium]MBT7754409.1 isoprenylcysteine carboxylmethyltransferase family protein [Gammaproteobacteria bacterium]MDG2434225.1 isoprenylcysteine carboxylmethyltransferase family protein [Gammaproteobacteria bacterium]
MKRFKYPPFLVLFGLIVQSLLSAYFPLYIFDYFPLILSIAFIFIGLCSIVFLLDVFKKKETAILPDGDPEVLLTQGPYSFSRNPIYLSMTVILIGSSMLYNCLSVFIIPILFAVLVKIIWIDYEEAKLKKIFGEEYLNYKKKTRRWI